MLGEGKVPASNPGVALRSGSLPEPGCCGGALDIFNE
jgi:hypothetical protein